MVDKAKRAGCEVFHFSSMHPSGESKISINNWLELNNLTGIACILRFPMPELDELDEEDQNFGDDD
jgi:protein pelota